MRLLVTLFCVAACNAQVATSRYSSSIPNAIAALGGRGGLVVVDRSYSSATTIFIPSNTTVSCLPGITVTQTSNNRDVFALSPNGTNLGLTGCRTAGGNNSIAGYFLNFFSIRANTFTGWHASAVTLGERSINGIIRDNAAFQGSPGCVDPIFIQDAGVTLDVEGNILDSGGCKPDGTHGLAIHTYTASGTSLRLTVRNNRIAHFAGNFPVEIGQFGAGATIDGCVVSGNHLYVGAPGNGGISMSGTSHCSVTDNNINMNRFSPGIAGIEVVNCLNTTVSGNHVWGGPADSNALVVDSSDGTIISGNEFSGTGRLVNSGTFPGVTRLSYNTFTGNVFTGSTGVFAFLLQCNIDGCTARGNTIRDNVFIGSGANAVYLEDDKGIVDGTQVLRNRISNFTMAVGQGAGVTNTEIQ